MTIFFTSDSHFGHVNIIKYCNRPFSSVEEMDEVLIQRWNEKVKDNDFVYHLGDFTLGEDAQKYFSRLKGQIIVLPGSHDHRWFDRHDDYLKTASSRYVTYAQSIVELDDFSLKRNIGFGQSKLKVRPNSKGILVLCHYAMLTWPMSHYGSYHLFGHSHGKLKGQPNSMDIGVDCTNFYPLSLDEVIEKLELTIDKI